MAIIGGLNSIPDIKVLVLYILNYAGRPLSKDNIIKIGMDSGTVEYFDLAQAIEEMYITGLTDNDDPENPELIRITEVGRQTLAMVERDLPHSVRRKNQASLLKLLGDIDRKNSVKSDIIKKKHGYEVVCTLLDGEDIMLEYKLYVPTQIQAQMIVDQFEKNPTEKYKSILPLLVDESVFEED